jgi:hypothetical protein
VQRLLIAAQKAVRLKAVKLLHAAQKAVRLKAVRLKAVKLLRAVLKVVQQKAAPLKVVKLLLSKPLTLFAFAITNRPGATSVVAGRFGFGPTFSDEHS